MQKMDEGSFTILNPEAETGHAGYQREEDDNPTIVNQTLLPAGKIREGTAICGKYLVSHKMDVTTGEADLYVCRYENEAYVAKIYRGSRSIKPEVADTVKKLDSPYVARVYETGMIEGCFVEILPFYKYGSLQGKRFEYEKLRSDIIPCLNEGLRVLHDAGIIHKDLKPSNVMLTAGQDKVMLIDFGISSMKEEGNTIVMTRTGMTPEYSAPETFRNLYLEESDYYSLGITIYELFCGTAPFRNMEPEEIERYVSVQKVPFPKEMPGDLKNLISALTYYDITNRKDKTNPNRRWGYDEVKRWCAGERMMVPGQSLHETGGIPPYTLGNTIYIDKQELIYALVECWEEGKKQLFRGILSSYFKTFDLQAAGYCFDAQEEAARQFGKEEILYWKTLYLLSGKTREFFWRGKVFGGLPELGREMLVSLQGLRNGLLQKTDGLREPEGLKQQNDGHKQHADGAKPQADGQAGQADDSSDKEYGESEFWGSILENRLLSAYTERMETGDGAMLESLRGLEAAYRSHYKRRDKLKYLYICGYLLTGEPELILAGRRFKTITGFTAYMKEMIQDSYDDFHSFAHAMLDEERNLDPQLEGWLTALGKEDKLEQWRQEII